MSYESEFLQNLIRSIVSVWSRDSIDELCDYIFMASSMFKNESWKLENEYRFFVHHKRELILRSALYRTRERSGEAISFLDIPIQNWNSEDDFPIFRIRLGPAAPTDLEVQLRDFLFSKGISVPIWRSEIPFHSVRSS